jgi:hypothetical protein
MSLRGDKYETIEEIKSRLEGTVVLYENEPVFINRVAVPGGKEDKDEIARVFFHKLPFTLNNRPPEFRRYLSSKKFDLTPFRMGYANLEKRTVFVSRSPVRQYKQGLTGDVTKLSEVSGERSELGFNTLVQDKGFVDMVQGVYPDFKTAGQVLEAGEKRSLAISRSFAFLSDPDLDILILMNKGVKCGIVLRGDKNIRLSKKFNFLKEELEEYRIPIG